MITLTGTNADGHDIAILGIDAENVRRLKDGKPIKVTIRCRTAITVYIHYEETLDLLETKFRDLMERR